MNRICPLLDNEAISDDDCYEYCLVAERLVKPDDILSEKAKNKPDFREICLACKYHDLD